MSFRTLIAALALMLLPLASVAQTESATSTATTVTSDEAVQSLLDVLQDDTARAALIEKLQADQASQGDQAADDQTALEQPAFAQRVAQSSVKFISNFVKEMGRVSQELIQSVGVLGNLLVNGEFRGEALQLMLTIVTTIMISIALQRGSNYIAGRNSPPPTAGFWRRVRATLLVTVLRLVAIAVAWVAGYLLANFLFSGDDDMLSAQSLYLNAFLVFGVIRVLLRAINSPNADLEPTLSVLAPGAQEIVYRQQILVAGVAIQGFLFVLPLVQDWLGFTAMRPMRTLIASVAAILAIIAVRRISVVLDLARGDRWTGESNAGSAVANGAQRAWRSIWPVLALAYIGYSWFIAISRPGLIETVVLRGTIFTFAALAILMVGMRLLRSVSMIHIRLPDLLLAFSPALTKRVNTVVMMMAWLAASFLILFSIVLAFSGWGWLDTDLLTNATAQMVFWRLISALLMALIAAVIWAVVDGWIDYRLSHGIGGAEPTNRTLTLLALFRNAFTITLIILATMITLSQIGINIAPLIAGAGVIGLAVGFGAQKLVQDVITGVFIQLENAVNVGDVVTVAAVTGGVEKVSIRTVRIRSLDGAVHIVPFSSVDTVTNLTRDFGVHVCEVGIAYREDVPRGTAAMQEAYDRIIQIPEIAADIISPLEIHGVTSLGADSVNIRGLFRTLPAKHWGIGRRFTQILKEVMDERGIEIPFPQRQLHFPEGFERLLNNPKDDDRVVEGTAKAVTET
ncbi:mechanosensitive ion channel domain-containing protein [Falsirhodobacter sp. alg1]|uniref:mechanosensitive ion channel domain-containing protein n=1 Tax=Falsirhodobacter sp. alg1 TaxID=1472418 RepID=UPI000788758F|nr:mechanosensitive ion channel domain-containing protein [Falsirhodobacter sp. alg1]